MYRIKTTLFFFFFLSLSLINKAVGQLLPLSPNTTVSVITCGTGDEMYSLFGHTALRIRDVTNQIDEVYNYGTFDFNTPNFYLKFIKGDLQYMATSNTYEDFIAEYVYEKRPVYEQILNLSQEQKQHLFTTLNTTLSSDERFYTYKFIDKNCTTMVVNLLNKILGQNILVKTVNTDITYREILYTCFQDHFYEKLGTSILFGGKVDQKATQLFLPSELQQSIQTTIYNNEPLCMENKTLLEFKENSTPVFSLWNNYYSLCLILLVILVFNNPKLYMFYFFILGLMGLFLTLASIYSLHPELANNYNILLFNPALLLLLYFYFKNNMKGIYTTSLFCVLSLLIYIVFMITKIHLLIVSPLVVVSGIGLVKQLISNKNKVIVVRN